MGSIAQLEDPFEFGFDRPAQEEGICILPNHPQPVLSVLADVLRFHDPLIRSLGAVVFLDGFGADALFGL